VLELSISPTPSVNTS